MAQVELTTPADLASLLVLLREQRVRSFRLGSLYVELQPDQKPADAAQGVSRETAPSVESLKDRAERLKREEEELLYASAGGR